VVPLGPTLVLFSLKSMAGISVGVIYGSMLRSKRNLVATNILFIVPAMSIHMAPFLVFLTSVVSGYYPAFIQDYGLAGEKLLLLVMHQSKTSLPTF